MTDPASFTRAQAIARAVLVEIAAEIRPGATEQGLVEAAYRLMLACGATGYWGSSPALVLAGPRLRSSVAGVDYRPETRPIGPDEMVTVDVGVLLGEAIGDCARSYFLRDGVVVAPEAAGAEAAAGMALEQALHARLMEVARPEMPFSELHREIDQMVQAHGYRNLDFMANYGHSIEAESIDGVDGQRVDGVLPELTLIEAACGKRLDAVPFITFEPHVARPESALAFKHEEMYRFADGRLQVV